MTITTSSSVSVSSDMSPTQSIHGLWSGRLAFTLAVAGATVGLSNIWRFPYMANEYGGGFFILIYLLFLALIGMPLMMSEIMIGRMGRNSPINSLRIVAEQGGRSRNWRLIGWLAMVAGLLIVSFYSVIAGWSLAYAFRMGGGVFSRVSTEGISTLFTQFVSDPEKLLAWHTLFMVVVYLIVARGLHRGIELAVKILMPLMLLLIGVLLIYAVYSSGFSQGMEQLFFPDSRHIEDVHSLGTVLMAAMGQAFFTLSLGTGAVMVYGAYLPRSIPISGTTLSIVLIDTLVAVVAGMIIFPLIYANGLEFVEFSNGLDGRFGPGLIFQTLPIAFGHMPWGELFGVLFFILLVIVALTSAIALMEPSVAYIVERWSLARNRATKVITVIVWLLGLLTIFSFNIWSGVRPLAGVNLFEHKTIYHLLDFVASNLLLPIGGLLTVIFAGWMLRWKTTEDELSLGQEYCGYAMWRIAVRYFTPVLLAIVFIYSLLKALGQIQGA